MSFKEVGEATVKAKAEESGLPRNDSFDGPEWDAFYREYMLAPRDRRLFRYHLALRHLRAPDALVRALNYLFGSVVKEYQTVVCDLKAFKPSKKVRYALKHYPVDEVRMTVDYDRVTEFIRSCRVERGLLPGLKDNLEALTEYGCGATYAAFKDGEIVGCLTIVAGERWITELNAAGLQDAIKMRVIEDYRGTRDYYDLAGYDGSERARFKRKWGVVTQVSLEVNIGGR